MFQVLDNLSHVKQYISMILKVINPKQAGGGGADSAPSWFFLNNF